jgi:hypothetical protein
MNRIHAAAAGGGVRLCAHPETPRLWQRAVNASGRPRPCNALVVRLVLAISLLGAPWLVRPAWAGVDVSHPAARMQVAPDGALWFAIEHPDAVTYCRQGWHNLNMVVPKDHPQYPYYYAMVLASVSKGKSLYVANISVFDGSAPCDITRTGYGLVLLQ